eukprot:11591786-Ditylum_brightwellii.AAC.2
MRISFYKHCFTVKFIHKHLPVQGKKFNSSSAHHRHIQCAKEAQRPFNTSYSVRRTLNCGQQYHHSYQPFLLEEQDREQQQASMDMTDNKGPVGQCALEMEGAEQVPT